MLQREMFPLQPLRQIRRNHQAMIVTNHAGSIIYNKFLFCLAFIHVILRAAPTCAALIFIFGVIHETVY